MKIFCVSCALMLGITDYGISAKAKWASHLLQGEMVYSKVLRYYMNEYLCILRYIISGVGDKSGRLLALRGVFLKMHPLNFEVLKFLISHLHKYVHFFSLHLFSKMFGIYCRSRNLWRDFYFSIFSLNCLFV